MSAPRKHLEKGEKRNSLTFTGIRKHFEVGKRHILKIEVLCDCGVKTFCQISAFEKGGKKRCDRNTCSLSGKDLFSIKFPQEYRIWASMKQRCSNPKDTNYKYYGGRGIKVSKEFEASFRALIEHIGKRPSKEYSLDRIDNNGNYERGNLRWADKSTQSKNTRSCKAYQPTINKLKELLGYNISPEKTVSSIRTKGNLRKKREYNIWSKIKSRCFNEKNEAFLNYGGRGITMHEDFQRSFYVFLSHVGESPDNTYSLDRIDNDGDYTYGNLRWVRRDVQANNRRTVAHSEKIIRELKQQCDKKGISYGGII